jgi:hypothetical protein
MGKIVWLASYPKSGNTWMRAFLHNLLANPAEPFDINRLDLLTAGDVEPGLYEAVAGKPASSIRQDEVIALRARVQERLAAEGGPDSRFVKTHSAVMSYDGHATINLAVTAGAIYLVRDPRDVAISFAHHLGVTLDEAIELMARRNAVTEGTEHMMSDYIGSWSQHVESWTARPSPSLHVVRYEDMASRPGRTFGEVVRFLGLKPPRARLERSIRHSSFKVLRGQEERHGFRERSENAERFFRSGRTGEWHEVLSATQAERLYRDHGTQMARFGYLPEGS